MNKLIALGAALAVGTIASAASAATIQHTGSFDGDGNHLYQLFDSIGATSYNTPGEVNAAQITNDRYWSVQASGGSVSTMIFEISANSGNTAFGVFDKANAANRVQLWGGGATQGAQVTMALMLDGSVKLNGADTGVDFANNAFGYFIQIGNTIFYSDEALNQDGADQMVTFRGNGSDTIQIPGYFPGEFGVDEYILGWEDILASTPVGPGGTDNDYNDLVVLVESVKINVPEPATLALFGAGLLGIGLVRRRKA